jgi:hypothetical protein
METVPHIGLQAVQKLRKRLIVLPNQTTAYGRGELACHTTTTCDPRRLVADPWFMIIIASHNSQHKVAIYYSATAEWNSEMYKTG